MGKNFLVEVVAFNGAVVRAAEYSDRQQAIVVATVTFRQSGLDVQAVRVLDADGDTVFELMVGTYNHRREEVLRGNRLLD